MPLLAYLGGFLPKEVLVRLGRRVWTSVCSGLHLGRRPRAVRAEGWRAKVPEEVKVGCCGVRYLTNIGVQRQMATPIVHKIPPPVCCQEVSVLRGQFVQALRGGDRQSVCQLSPDACLTWLLTFSRGKTSTSPAKRAGACVVRVAAGWRARENPGSWRPRQG